MEKTKKQLEQEIAELKAAQAEKDAAAEKAAAEKKNEDDASITEANNNHQIAISKNDNDETVADIYKSKLKSLSEKKDSDLMDGDAEYLKLELGQRYDVLFTGDCKKIPDKINENPEGILCVCGFRFIDGGVLKPFINADVMVIRKVQEWAGNGQCNRENPIAVRMIVAPELAGKTGQQFKNISFRLD